MKQFQKYLILVTEMDSLNSIYKVIGNNPGIKPYKIWTQWKHHEPDCETWYLSVQHVRELNALVKSWTPLERELRRIK